jgi:hypothetical protein
VLGGCGEGVSITNSGSISCFLPFSGECDLGYARGRGRSHDTKIQHTKNVEEAISIETVYV